MCVCTIFCKIRYQIRSRIRHISNFNYRQIGMCEVFILLVDFRVGFFLCLIINVVQCRRHATPAHIRQELGIKLLNIAYFHELRDLYGKSPSITKTRYLFISLSFYGYFIFILEDIFFRQTNINTRLFMDKNVSHSARYLYTSHSARYLYISHSVRNPRHYRNISFTQKHVIKSTFRDISCIISLCCPADTF